MRKPFGRKLKWYHTKKSPNLMGMYNFIRMLLNNSRLNTTYVQKNSKIKNSDSKFNTSSSFFL